MFTNSIRWRLQLWLASLLVLVLSGFGVTVYQLQRIEQTSQLDAELERRITVLSAAVRGGGGLEPGPGRGPGGLDRGRPPFEDRRPPDFDDGGRRSGPGRGAPPDFGRGGPGMGPGGPRDFKLPADSAYLFDTTTNGFYYAVWLREGTVTKQSSNAPVGVSFPDRQRGDTRTHTRLRETYREAYHFTERGDCVLAGRSISDDLKEQRRLALVLLAAGGGILALGLGGGWWLAGRAIRPVEQISATAARISAGNLSERVNVADTDDELGRVAAVLNSTFARLESAFAQQKQFTADASHELRTPLAVIISEAQTTLARERSAAEYRETIQTCLDAAQQMRRLCQSLLELARWDAGQEIIERKSFDLSEHARISTELIRPLAKERGLKMACELTPVSVVGDSDRIGQVIVNLLTNAIHYNQHGGEIRITTRAEVGNAVLTVSDTGQGIAPADLPHIFERFYRADKSRSRVEGQSGLGLAICKAIVDAHGGSIEVTSQVGEGTTFTVRLPA